MPRSDWNIVKSSTYYFPTTNNEAVKVSSIFEVIDGLITLHQRTPRD